MTHVACLASDSRHPADVAARAAVRYDVNCLASIHKGSLPARGREQSRELFGSRVSKLNESAAEKLFQEERDRASTTQSKCQTSVMSAIRNADSVGLRDAFEAGSQACLLYGLGACTRSEASCGKAHVCPYCGQPTRGCLVKNHWGSISRHAPQQDRSDARGRDGGKGHPDAGSRRDRTRNQDRDRSRSRDRGRGTRRVKEEDEE